MHTLASLVLLIGTLMVAVVGTYTIYWNLSVYRSLQERSMRSRTLWTTAAVFAVTIFIASAWLTATFHVDTVPVVITERIAITYIPINLFFGLATLVLFYVTGDRTLMAASKHDYQLKQPRGPERIVAKLRFLIWPLLSIFLCNSLFERAPGPLYAGDFGGLGSTYSILSILCTHYDSRSAFSKKPHSRSPAASWYEFGSSNDSGFLGLLLVSFH